MSDTHDGRMPNKAYPIAAKLACQWELRVSNAAGIMKMPSNGIPSFICG